MSYHPRWRGTKLDTVGEDTTISYVVRVDAGNGVKGAWQEISASTPHATEALLITVADADTSTTPQFYQIDLGVGAAGSEVVLFANLEVYHSGVTVGAVRGRVAWPLVIPLHLPAGVRLAVRAQGGAAGLNDVCGLAVVLIGGGLSGYRGLNRIPARNFATIDPGAVANTKGAWVAYTASSGRDTRWLYFYASTNAGTSSSNIKWLVDIGVGAAGSEKVIIPNVPLAHTGADRLIKPSHTGPFSVSIPVGTRIAARAQCNITTASVRLIVSNLYYVG